MAEPTVNRQTLRRAIGRGARMQFYLRYPLGQLTFTDGSDSNAGSASTEVFYCNKLTQGEGFWDNAWMYVLSTDSGRNGLERRISNFNADQDALYLEWPCDTDEVATTDDQFELLDIWPPTQVHEAINDAIRDSWRIYPDVVTNESMVIEEDKIEYDLTGLSQLPARMMQVYVERSSVSYNGQVTNVSSSDVFGDTTIDLSFVTASTTSASDWRVGIYKGTGHGQLYELTSADTTTQLFTVDSAGATDPDTDTYFTIWNQNEKSVNWYRVLNLRFDAPEFPSYMYTHNDWSGSYGLRWRLVYLAQPSELDADTDVTTIPQYFIKNKAMANLHDVMVEDNRADRRDHSAIAEHHDQLARAFAAQNPRRLPQGTVWQEGEVRSGGMYNIDPLGWRG